MKYRKKPVDGIRMPDKPTETHTEPRPLLYEAKVGWICSLSDGSHTKINSVSYTDDGQKFCICENGFTYDEYGNENFHATAYPHIISAEPLAEAGTKERALQDIKLGHKVTKEGGGERYSSSFYKNRLFYLNGSGCLVTKNGIGLIDPCSEEEFLSLDETGWQIYDPALQANGLGDYEPEPQPDLPVPGEPVTKCMICNKDAIVDDKTVFLDAKTGKVWHLQCSSDLISGVFASVVSSPQPNVKVGDWATDGVVTGKVTSINGNIANVKTPNATYVINTENLEKVPRSEVKVSITLEGTVCESLDPHHENTHFYIHFPGTEDDKDSDRWALISFNLLSPADAALVRELVEEK